MPNAFACARSSATVEDVVRFVVRFVEGLVRRLGAAVLVLARAGAVPDV